MPVRTGVLQHAPTAHRAAPGSGRRAAPPRDPADGECPRGIAARCPGIRPPASRTTAPDGIRAAARFLALPRADAMPSLLHSFDLHLEDIPAPDAAWKDIWRFTTTSVGNGAYGLHSETCIALRDQFVADGPGGLTLDDLRGLLHITQRAHYHQGGGYPGEPDRLMERMRALVGAIGERVRRDGTPRLTVLKADITRLETHGIVNAANPTLLGGGGVDGAVHNAAGPTLRTACLAIPEVAPGVRCPVGESRATLGFELPARWVIHTVGPRWTDGEQGEPEALLSAYRSSLRAALTVGCRTLAIPALSTGVYGYPPDRAAGIAVAAVQEWHRHTPLPRVVLVGYDEAATAILDATLRAADEDG